jgi:hypothetical protein
MHRHTVGDLWLGMQKQFATVDRLAQTAFDQHALDSQHIHEAGEKPIIVSAFCFGPYIPVSACLRSRSGVLPSPGNSLNSHADRHNVPRTVV